MSCSYFAPAIESAQAHVCDYQAGGGADSHAEIAPKVFHVPGVPDAIQTQPINPDAEGVAL